MIRTILVCLLLFTLVTPAWAVKTKVIDTTGWTQEQKNRGISAINYALNNAGRPERVLSYERIAANQYELSFPDSLPDGVFNAITATRILQEIANIDAENATNAAAELADFNAKKNSIRTKLTTGTAWTDEEVDFLYSVIRRLSSD